MKDKAQKSAIADIQPEPKKVLTAEEVVAWLKENGLTVAPAQEAPKADSGFDWKYDAPVVSEQKPEYDPDAPCIPVQPVPPRTWGNKRWAR